MTRRILAAREALTALAGVLATALAVGLIPTPWDRWAAVVVAIGTAAGVHAAGAGTRDQLEQTRAAHAATLDQLERTRDELDAGSATYQLPRRPDDPPRPTP